MDNLTQPRDSDLVTDSIFFDFTKVSDKVPHQLLVHKPQEYEITGNTEMVGIIPNLEDSPSSSGIHHI